MSWSCLKPYFYYAGWRVYVRGRHNKRAPFHAIIFNTDPGRRQVSNASDNNKKKKKQRLVEVYTGLKIFTAGSHRRRLRRAELRCMGRVKHDEI